MPTSDARPRFTQCWQDAETVVAVARHVGAGSVGILGGTGDLALDLAAAGLSVDVTPVDPDGAALTELKLAAARDLPLSSVTSFLGLGHFGRRVWFYHHLRPRLSGGTRAWGDGHEDAVRTGLLSAGRFERAVGRLRRALRVERPHGTAWELLLGALGAPLIRRRSGLGATPGPGGPSTWIRRVDVDRSPFCTWLATGAWPDPAAAHPWLGAAGFDVARRSPPVLRPPGDLPDLPLLVVPDAAEYATDADWGAWCGRLRPGAHVLVFERWRTRAVPGATEVSPHPVPVPDRSPRHARVRLWSISG